MAVFTWFVDDQEVADPNVRSIDGVNAWGSLTTATTLDPGDHTIRFDAAGAGFAELCLVVIIGSNTEDDCVTLESETGIVTSGTYVIHHMDGVASAFYGVLNGGDTWAYDFATDTGAVDSDGETATVSATGIYGDIYIAPAGVTIDNIDIELHWPDANPFPVSMQVQVSPVSTGIPFYDSTTLHAASPIVRSIPGFTTTEPTQIHIYMETTDGMGGTGSFDVTIDGSASFIRLDWSRPE